MIGRIDGYRNELARHGVGYQPNGRFPIDLEIHSSFVVGDASAKPDSVPFAERKRIAERAAHAARLQSYFMIKIRIPIRSKSIHAGNVILVRQTKQYFFGVDLFFRFTATAKNGQQRND